MRQPDESVFVIMMGGLMWPVTALAEETVKPAGSYAASDYVWFSVIGIILAYGMYDTFFKTP